jgi:putative heme-binding domain-containing protein
MPSRRLAAILSALTWTILASAADAPPTLARRLASESITELAKAVRERGDAGRGAVLFFQPYLACAKCHDGADGARLGPDLSRIGKEGTAEHLIESVLSPSKAIRKGYEPLSLLTTDGRTITGLVVNEQNGMLRLIDPAAGDKTLSIPAAEIERRSVGGRSLMPEGLIDALSDRQQFLDLCKYLVDIAEGGPNRARELRPTTTGIVIPEYEKNIDHAGLIRNWNAKSLERGEALYDRVCANCHGTTTRAGSLPTSPKFATHTFKNGSDPESLYRTLTHGYGQMAPQTWMAPRQKYDVIHYLREAYLKPHNPSQYRKVDAPYLAGLPKGNTFGPEPSTIEPWAAMDYGSSFISTYEVGGPGPNIAYKGIALRLDSGVGGVSRGRRFAIFDHDIMHVAAAWTGEGFIDWNGVQFNGKHEVHPKLVGDVHFASPVGPGWANPKTGSFEDSRLRGRDGRPYGPLPKEWAKFRGLHYYGDQTIVSYSVGDAPILELAGAESDSNRPSFVAFSRTLEIGKSSHDLTDRVAPMGVSCAVVGKSGAKVVTSDGFSLLRIPAEATPLRLKVLIARCEPSALETFAKDSPPPRALEPLTHGGPKRWPDVLHSPVFFGKEDGPFTADTFVPPDQNPWNALLRLTGFDFLPDGDRMAVCSWDGDVWLVSGLDHPESGLTWQRIASGLFQPLGLKIRDGEIFVGCRDQIVRLHDRNNDGEIDFYECFNNDHQVTEHFHEFAMGLQTDAEGNFYYAKGARHAKEAIVPHHGTLLKVSKDGSTTEILATGFRAPNGVCLNPDGTFFITDQEGHWTPKNRINLVEKGGFYGNLAGYTDITDPSDAAMKQPLCWITNAFDRSPSELLWVPKNTWGPLAGSLLNFSYGYGKISVVPHERVNGQVQGGMCALPLPQFPTGVMRGRFREKDGHLYCCGMFSWAGNQVQPGGFYRVRTTGKPMDLPIGLKATSNGVEIAFTDQLDQASASDPRNYEIKVWDLKRSREYGSKHFGERTLKTSRATLSSDAKSVRLEIPGLAPTKGMEIKYRLKGKDGRAVANVIHNTIHHLGESSSIPLP